MHDSNTSLMQHPTEPINSRGILRALYRERWAALLIALAAHLIAFTVVINTTNAFALAKLEIEEERPTIDIGVQEAEIAEQAAAEGADENDEEAAQKATSVSEPQQIPFTPPRFDPVLPGQFTPKVSKEKRDPAQELLTGIHHVKTMGKGRGSAGKAAYGNRGKARRRNALRVYGGSEKTESAMEDGLSWLAGVQQLDPDDPEHYGAWDARKLPGADLVDKRKALLDPAEMELPGGSFDELGLTALSMLAFTGAGYTRTHGAYTQNVRAATDYLIRHQRDDGYFASPVRSAKSGNMYDHSIALLALADMYALTGESDLSAPVEMGLNFLLGAQQSNGGWDYDAYGLPALESKQRFDVSISGFAVMALMSCKAGGFEIPEEAVERFVSLIKDHATAKDGWGIYANRREGAGRRSVPITAVNYFLRMLLGEDGSGNPIHTKQHELMLDPVSIPDWDTGDGADNNPYGWYYTSLGLMMHGDDMLWQQFNVPMKRELLNAQFKGRGGLYGSWPPVVDARIDEHGNLSLDTIEWSDRGGRIYTTAMACLCLQVYYRYAPEFLKAEGSDYTAMWK